MTQRVPFSEIPITTSVFIAHLPFDVNLSRAFSLLAIENDPASETEFLDDSDEEEDEETGRITSIGYGDIRRGEEGEKKNYCFPNCINIKMDIGDKFLNIKLCPKQLQVTGVKNRDQILRGWKMLTRHLLRVHYLTELISDRLTNPPSSIYSHFINITKEDAIKELCEAVNAKEEQDKINFINWLIDPDQGGSLLKNIDEKAILDIENELIPAPIKSVMINKNFCIDLKGKKIQLGKLAQAVPEHGKLSVVYNNCIHHNVTINTTDQIVREYGIEKGLLNPNEEIEQDTEYEKKGKKKNTKNRNLHKIIINSSGQATQSWRSEKIMAIFYDMFMDFIENNMEKFLI